MDNIEDNKHKKINDIISVVKLSSLLFSGIIMARYFFGENNVRMYADYYLSSIFSIIMPILILAFIYIIWSTSTANKFNLKSMKYMYFTENIIFVLLFSIIVFMSGANKSEYKSLFLFIIITATIQSGMKQGIIVSATSSVIILTIDIIFGHGMIVNQYFENDLIISGIFILTAFTLGFYVRIENEHIKKLKDLVNEDGLTGVYNHRYFHEILREKILRSEENNRPVSMIFMDIDYFKHYNDLNGHQKGDEVLRSIGSILKDIVGERGMPARYGGEEFSIILPNTYEAEAINLAEKIRSKVETTTFFGEENQPNGKLTVSLGISTYPYKAKNDMELIKSADDALYRAKFFNKNRVESYTSVLDELKSHIEEEEHIEIITSIKTLISVINVKDRYTYGHCERIVIYSRLFAETIGLREEDKKKLIYGAYMHDIGKINISKEILNKKMKLTAEEWELLKQHPLNGVEIIKPVKALNKIEPLILYHHERYDGNGYPTQLKGEAIPYLARVLTVIDSFDAMTSNRPYNKSKTYEEAIEELKKGSGTQFDPNITKQFIEIIMENRDKFDNLRA